MSGLGRGVRWAGGGVLAVGATVGLVLLSAAPLPPAAGPDEGVVRLSWRIRGDAEAGCRLPTPEELARLPAHMRDPDACMGSGTPWRLAVALDGVGLVADTLEPAGARGDRPVFVLREIPVPAGRHRLEVVFEPVGGSEAPGHHLLETIEVAPREVALVTYDAEAERLVLRARSIRP